MFVYQLIFDRLDGKKDKGTDYVFSWKSKGVYTSKLKPLYTVLWHSIKLSGYKMAMKLDKDPLAVKPNNYTTTVVYAYIIYDLDNMIC